MVLVSHKFIRIWDKPKCLWNGLLVGEIEKDEASSGFDAHLICVQLKLFPALEVPHLSLLISLQNK